MSSLSHTQLEIDSQPEVWSRTIDAFDLEPARLLIANGHPNIVVTGCGSTYYLALAAAAMLRDELGLHARAVPASEIALPAASLPGVTSSTLIAISRSGTTSETVAAVDRFRHDGGTGVALLTNYPNTALAQSADVLLSAPAGQEESIAQTRSFTTMLLTFQALVGALKSADLEALKALPAIATDLLKQAQGQITDFGRDLGIERIHFLGSGPLFGVASEGMLKLKEMSLTDSEAFHTLEYRHGPMSMASSATAVIGLISPDRSEAEHAVLTHLEGLGAQTTSIGHAANITVPSGLPSWTRPVLHLLPLQVLALERALAKGLNPDQPRHLAAVIQLVNLGR